MTNEEAHGWLENKQRLMTENRWYFSSTDVEANGKAIEALEKQIPKKPTIKESHEFDPMGKMYVQKYYFCGNCRALITNKTCSNCGQRIDWSEEDGV